MDCVKCGNPVDDRTAFCTVCGTANPGTQPVNFQSVPQSAGKPATSMNILSLGAILLLGLGAAIALFIFLFSWLMYGKIYFFDGFIITILGWVVSFAATGIGMLVAVVSFVVNGKNGDKGLLIVTAVLMVVVPVVLLCSGIINGIKESEDSDDDYTYTDYADIIESCHSTSEHIQAIYSYDLNNDNYLSEYELSLFAEAHQGLYQTLR